MKNNLLLLMAVVGLLGMVACDMPPPAPEMKSDNRISVKGASGYILLVTVNEHKYIVYEHSQAATMLHDQSCECLKK